MPITRKVIEILAPRTALRSPEQPTDGDGALAEFAGLIERRIDPERALEAALRMHRIQEPNDTGALGAVGAAKERGGTPA